MMKKNLLLTLFVFTSLIITAQNSALSFDGSNDNVNIGQSISSNSSYTREAWIYPTNLSGARNIISSLNTPFWINGGILSAGQAGNYSLVTDPVALTINVWIYVALTYDAATTTMKLYKNGILVSTNNSVSAYSAETTYIGAHNGAASFLQGYADEIRIWNFALTQAQLKMNLTRKPKYDATGLVVYYECNDGTGTVLTNSCTNTAGLDGALQNGTGWAASPVQIAASAIAFDGTNDVVTVPDNNTLDITSAITLEAWCYATKNTSIQNVISKSSNTTNTGYIFPRTDDGWANAVVYLHIGGSWRTLSAIYPSLNAWHHLAATYDGSMMKVYIDGVLSGSMAQTGAIAANANLLTLGNQVGYVENFGGYADEFRIWNIARTQTEIQDNMNRELDPATQTGLVSYYTVNQGSPEGTNAGLMTLIDLAGNNNGTLTGFALSGNNSNYVTQNSALAVLPVSLISFTAQKSNHSVLLEWSTASEQNTKNFIIQHSDGSAWTNIHTVAAAGNSNTVRNYSHLHIDPVNGINYYRILQTDIDGRSSYFDTRTVKFTVDESRLVVLNNPVTRGMLKVRLSVSSMLSIYNSNGSMIWQKQVNPGTEMINLSGLPKGAYYLQTNNQTEKILVQ